MIENAWNTIKAVVFYDRPFIGLPMPRARVLVHPPNVLTKNIPININVKLTFQLLLISIEIGRKIRLASR